MFTARFRRLIVPVSWIVVCCIVATMQGVSAERSRTTSQGRALKGTPKLVTQAELTPAGAQPIDSMTANSAAPVVTAQKPGASVSVPAAGETQSASSAKLRDRASVEAIRVELEGAYDAPKTVDVTPNEAPIGNAIPAGAFNLADIAAGTGACCTSCPNAVCQDNVAEVDCTSAGGVWRGKDSLCSAQAASCICRACCEPDGGPLNNTAVDVRIDVCCGPDLACDDAGENTFHAFASWQNTANLPSPICNPYDANADPFVWDNGPPLVSDGGAQRDHIDAENGATGYAFTVADDIVIRGPDSTKVEFTDVEAWFMMRPSEPEVPVPDVDVSAYLVTVLADRPALDGTPVVTAGGVPLELAFPQPGGFYRTPRTSEDCAAPEDDNDGDGDVVTIARCDITYPHHRLPGGVLYSRIFPFLNAVSPINHTAYCDVFTCPPNPCNPPDAGGNFEGPDYYRVQISNIVPPIVLNKNDPTDGNPNNDRYWVAIQGVFPFADGLRSTLQTWAALSQNATGQRAKGFRSQNASYFGQLQCTVDADCPSGDEGYADMVCVSNRCRRNVNTVCANNAQCLPVAPGATCINNNCYLLVTVPFWIDIFGNRDDAACPDAPPAQTRRDLAFKLTGQKTPPGVPGDTCQTAVSVFDGVIGYTNVGAVDHGTLAASCGNVPNDLYFQYTATCNGIATFNAGMAGATIVVYNNQGCLGDGGSAGSEANELPPVATSACSTTGSVQERVNQGGTYLIRVGNSTPGKGFLSITCDDPCYFGSLNSAASCCPVAECDDPGDCTVPGEECSPEGFCARPCANDGQCLPAEPICSTLGDGYCHAALFGCKSPAQNETCCRTVCGDDAACCGSFGGTYDFFCISEARGEPGCACPCALDTSGFDVDEGEYPGGDPDRCDQTTSLNNALANSACAQDPPTTVTPTSVACGQTFRGTVWADANTRDIDYWDVVVTDTNNDGKANINLNIQSQAPVVVSVVDKSQCATACDVSNPCPAGVLLGTYDCDAEEDGFCGVPLYDSAFAAGCGMVPLTVTVDIPTGGSKIYSILITTFDQTPDNADDPDDNPQLTGKFAGLPCGTQNEYLINVQCDDDGPYPTGGCCACTGGCTDIDLIDCIQSNGTWTGGSDDETCATAPCTAYQHGCTDATPVTLVDGAATVTATPSDARPPTEPLPCAGGAVNDSAWFVVTVPDGVDSIGVKTCDSGPTGRDSVVALYCGLCCDPAPTYQFKTPSDGCSDDECGFTGLNSRLCTQNLTNADGGADEFAACRNMDGSVTLYIQVANFAEPVDGTYELDINAPCTGSCCDSTDGSCTDDVALGDCLPPLRSRIDATCDELQLPCGRGACCQDNGACSNVTGSNNCPGGNFYGGATCDTPSTNGYICNPADSCDYDHRPRANNGTTVQIFTDLNVIFEAADNVLMKGTTENLCQISQVSLYTFNSNHQSPNCNMVGGPTCEDTPQDFEGVVLLIAADIDGTGPLKAPICEPRLPVDGQPPFHSPLDPNCREYVFGPGSLDPLDPGINGWWWISTNTGGQFNHEIIMQIEPPIELEKNKEYWMGWAPIMPLTDKYQVVWIATTNLDGNIPVRFASNGTQNWEPTTFFDPPRDMYFFMQGNKEHIGDCGGCVVYMDFEPFFCIVDIADVLKTLQGYAEAVKCTTNTTTGVIVGSAVFDGGCPQTCSVDSQCVASGGCENPPCPGVCANGRCCDLTDIAEIIAVLDMFADATYTTGSCPNPCPHGACQFDPAGPDPVCCRDVSYFDPNSAAEQGTSLTDCFQLNASGFVYSEVCANAFPGTPVCNSP